MDELNLKDFISILWKWKFLIIIVTLIAMVAGVGKCVILNDFSISNMKDEKKVDLKESIVAGNRFITTGYIPEYLDTYNKIILTKEFQTELSSKLSFKVEKEELKKMVAFISDSDSRGTYVAEIVSVNENKEQAKELVDITKEMFLEKLATIYPEFKITDLEDTHILTTKEKKKNANIKKFLQDYSEDEEDEELIDEKDTQYGLKDFLKFEIAIAIIGFGVSVIIVLFIEMYDTKLKSSNQLKANGINDLLSINKKEISIISKYDLLLAKLEEYKKISFNLVDDDNEKNEEVIFAFAKKLKENKENVLIIDISNNIIKDTKGIIDYLKSKDNLDEYIKTSNEIPVLPFGSAEEIIHENDLSKVIDELDKKYTKVLIYSANSNTNGNSLVADKICKNCIIVSTIGKTKLPEIITCKNNLEDVKCHILGSIVIK